MNLSGSKPKVVLFHPHYFEGIYDTSQRQPLDILSVSAFPEKKGYEVVIIDASVTKDYEQRVLEECEDAICFGTTSILGYQVYHCNQIEKTVKERFPSLPIVAGGWFPTVETEMVLNGGGADIVVIRQGETTFMELLEALSSGESFEGIEGLAYKNNGEIVRNPPREIEDINKMPPMPYHLINFDDYFNSDTYERAKLILYVSTGKDFSNTEIRGLDYFSSYGCPDGCTFCSSPTVTGRKWTALKADRMVDEIDYLVKKHHFNWILFIDANWGVSEKRVYEFCEGILKKGIKFYWGASVEAHVMNKYDEEVVNLMAKSGCIGLLIGAEAAHPATMKSLEKNIKPGDIIQCGDICAKNNIIPQISYIAGYPDESEESVQATLNECSEIIYRFPKAEAGIRLYIPIPGTPLYHRAVSMGYKEVKSIENWRGFQSLQSELFSAINPKQLKTVRQCQQHYYWWASEWSKGTKKPNIFEKILNKTSRFRLKYKILSFPIEYKLYHLLRRLKHSLISR
jgi:radical SAM superfamily enzyme YgiQ (UPF0313 family)